MTNLRNMLCVASSTLALIPAAALAQQATEGDQTGTLEDIIVTAQRRAESLQKVPIAIAAVSGDTLSDAGIQTIGDLTAVAPGLNVTTQGSGNLLFFLRGIGSSNGSVGDEPSIATYVDGFYVAEAPTALLSLNSIERIEVLKGPQGTLYGRNAAGGLVGITTRDPGLDPAAELGLSYENYDKVTGTFYGSAPLADGLAANISAFYARQHDGWGRNFTTGEVTNRGRQFATRGKIKFEPSDSMTITLSGDYSDYDTGIGTTRTIFPNRVTFDTSAGPISFPTAVGPGGARPIGSIYDSRTNYGNRTKGYSWAGGLKVDQDFGSFSLVSLTGYRKNDKLVLFDQDAAPLPIVNANINQSSEQYSQELQLLSPEGSAFRWIVGGYFFQFNTRYDPLHIFSTPTAVQRFIYNQQKTRSLAVFAQITAELGPSTNLTIGGRYTWDTRKVDGALLLNNITTAATIAAKQKSDRPSWRIAIDQQIGPDVLAYASYSRGFKSGVFNLVTFSTVPVEDEVLDAYEVGFKSELLDRTLRFNASSFYYKYSNLQLQKYLVGGSALTNAAKAELYGLDLEAVIAPVRNFTARLGMSLLHTEYKSFASAPFEFLAGTVTCPAPNMFIPTGGAPTGGNIVCEGNARGNRLSRAPAVTFNAGIDYTLPTRFGDLGLNVNYFFSDKYFWGPDNFYQQKSYSLLNAQVSLDINEHIKVRVFGANLTDTQYFAGQNGGALGTNAIAAAPRTYGVGLNLKL